MAINTDSLITLDSGGVTYGKIGVSKSLNQVSIGDIWDAVYCSSDNPTLCEMKATFTGETPWFDDVLSPLTFMERSTGSWNYGNQELCYKLTSGADNTAQQLYGRVVWLYTTETPRYESHRCVKASNASDFKLITQMNVQQFELLENDLSGYSSWGNRPKPASFNDTNIEFMPYINLKIFEESDTQHNGNSISVSNVYPFIICKFNDKICLFYGWDYAYWLSLQTKDTINETRTGKQFYYLTTYDGTDFCFNTSMRVSTPFTTWELDQYQDYYGTDINEQHLTYYSKRTDNTNWREFQIAPANKTALNTWISRFGLYFRTDKKYKPIVINGYVSGFTDDFTIESEIDNYTGQMQHTVPDVSPSGGGGGGTGDELTDMLSRGQFYGSGLTKYYVDAPAVKLQKALGDWDNIATGKDVLQNLLSYKILCFPASTFSNGVTDPFVIAGTELKDEDDNTITAKRLTSTGAVNLPSITIAPTFNDFRDYAPYTKLQMFVPLCGWFDLPPWCMGRTISGEMYINPYSGTVRCLVRADGNVVAELGGNAAIDLPFNATAVGMKSAAVLSNLIQTAGAVGRAVMLPTVNTLAGAGSAALGAVCAMNANYTESKGTMGDGSNVYGLYNVYIKITRPSTVDNSGNSLVTIPDQYKHDYGRPCNKQLTLTAGDGYTQIMDANITGTMTDREKQMIIDGFRHGLIL